MDVDATSFFPNFLSILSDVSEAHFVALDLELSGVPSKDFWSSRSGRSTLQERYLETKEAAERYQILQIGLTCVEQDLTNGKYILKPYNLELSPLITERGLDVERIFSFQSGAVDFLIKAGFDIRRPFKRGVPYLSREESRLARANFHKRQDRSTVADIQIKTTDTESLALVERVRDEIKAWLASRERDKPDYLDIRPVGIEAVSEVEAPAELSRYEKRLVHQLVRAEFPDLVTIGKQGSIQIVHFNKEREDRIAVHRRQELEDRIQRQKGFRWVVEAMRGANISNFDVRHCAKHPRTGAPIFADLDDHKARFHRASGWLENRPVILVGHNCFLDLVYIYRTFIGDLPETVEDFQKLIHQLWPVIVDTKYMSTHNCGDINPVSSLEQIAEQLNAEIQPLIQIHPEHTKYTGVQAFHEAGYDSYLTAQVAIKLSAKLEREGAYVELAKKLPEPEEKLSNRFEKMNLDWHLPGTSNPTSNWDSENPSSSQADGTAATEAEGFTPSIVGGSWRRWGDPTLAPLPEDTLVPYVPDGIKRKRIKLRATRTFEGGMPAFGSDFWRVYGNKLRVFGTEEGVCVLDGSQMSVDSEYGV